MATVPVNKMTYHARACQKAAEIVKFWLIHETPEELHLNLNLKEGFIRVSVKDSTNKTQEWREFEEKFTW